MREHEPALLLMRMSAAQIYCANVLFQHGVIDRVVIEDGSAIEASGRTLIQKLWRYGPHGIAKRIARDVAHFHGNASECVQYYRARFATYGLWSRRRRHETSILGPLGRRLDPQLVTVRVRSVNDSGCRFLIRDAGYRLIFVFGTGVLKPALLEETGATFVNLHWGLLPTYRGEGIISALTQAGVQGLGVTVHVIDRGIDSGPIVYQQRLRPEPRDNVYAIGLRLTVLGTQHFLHVYEDVRRGRLRSVPQHLAEGKLYTSGGLKTGYWRLRAAQEVLAENRRHPGASAVTQVGTAVQSFNGAAAHRVKRVAASLGLVTGAAALGRRFHKASVRILMYHGVMEQLSGPAAFGNLFLSAGSLSRHLAFLRKAFAVMPLDEAVDRIRDGRRLPDRAVAVTFDDGYRNVLTTALPIARACRVPITVFVPAGQIAEGICSWFDVLRVVIAESLRERRRVRISDVLSIDGGSIRHPEAAFARISQWIADRPDQEAVALINRLEVLGQELAIATRYPEFTLAGWDEWRRAIADGPVTVGSHGLTHRDLRQLSPDECVHELMRSKQLIEEAISRQCRIVAYPYGAWNAPVAEAARLAGYTAAVTTDHGLNAGGSDLFALRRTTIGDKGQFSLFCARTSGLLNGASRRP